MNLDAIETKIKEISFNETKKPIQFVSGKYLAKKLRELVSLARYGDEE